MSYNSDDYDRATVLLEKLADLKKLIGESVADIVSVTRYNQDAADITQCIVDGFDIALENDIRKANDIIEIYGEKIYSEYVSDNRTY